MTKTKTLINTKTTIKTKVLTLTPLCQMIKINKFKKQTDRLLVVSEKKLYKVDAAKIKVQINRATWQPG